MITSFKIFESTTDIRISPPRQQQKKGGGHDNYKYYAIFEEMFIPKRMIMLISPTKEKENSGTHLLKEIIINNPYKSGLNEFVIFPTYVNSNVDIDGKKYDKIIFNDHFKTPFETSEEKIKQNHKELILSLLNINNHDNIDLSIIKFKNYSSFIMKIDDDWWDDLIEEIKRIR